MATNPTTIWTPQGGWTNPNNPGYAAPYTGPGPVANQPYYAASVDENGNPIMTLVPQSGQAQAVKFTGANGLVTTGVMNPYGFGQNMPSLGYYGANPNVTPQGAPTGPAKTGSAGSTPNTTPGSSQRLINVPGSDLQIVDTPINRQAYGIPQDPSYGRSDAINPPSRTATPTTPASQSQPQSPYLSGVTSNYIDPNTQQPGGVSVTNPLQFASPSQAAIIAARLGGTAQGTQLTGPDSFSQPQQMIGFAGGQPGTGGQPGINAGLAGGELAQYGGAPNSYGAYIVARDKAAVTGQSSEANFPSYAQWFGQQTGGGSGGGGTGTGGPGTVGTGATGTGTGTGGTGGGTGSRNPILPPVYVPPAPRGLASTGGSFNRISPTGGNIGNPVLNQFPSDQPAMGTVTSNDPVGPPSGENAFSGIFSNNSPDNSGLYQNPGSGNYVQPPSQSTSGNPIDYSGGGVYYGIDPNTGAPYSQGPYQPYQLPSSMYNPDGTLNPDYLNRWGTANPTLNNGGLYNGVQPIYSQPNGEGLQYKTQNDRALAIGGGEALQNQFSNYSGNQALRAAGYENALASAYSPLGAGAPAYTQTEQDAILNQPALNALQLTDQQQQQNYLTPDEQASIAGNPYQAVNTFNAGADNQNSAFNSNVAWQQAADAANGQIANDVLANSATGVRGAYNNWSGTATDYLGQQAGNVRDAYGTGATNVNNSLNYGSNLVQGGIDPTAMRTSQDYLTNYQFGPQDQQDLIAQAGETVQSQEQADQDQLMRQANSQGNTTPLALAAMQNRMRQTGEINAANAMTNARIQGKQLGLQTTQQREATRLGAEQNLEGLQTNANLNLAGQDLAAQEDLAQRGTAAEEYLGSSALNTGNILGAAQQGAEQYLGNQRLQSQQFQQSQSNAALANLQAQNLQNQQNITAGSTAATQTAEGTAAQRALTAAQNRQTTSQANQQNSYNRGMNIYQAGSQANQLFAGQRLAQGQEYRNYLTGQQQQASQNVGVGQQQQLGTYGTQTGATNAASGNAINNYAVPGLWKQIAGSLSRGGVVRGERPVLMGEGGKPELLIDLSKIDRANLGGGPYVPYDSESGQPMQQPYDSETGQPMMASPQNPQNAAQQNPLWLRILQAMRAAKYGGAPANQAQQAATQQPKAGGGLIGTAIGLGEAITNPATLLAGARGIVSAPSVGPSAHHFYGARKPGMGTYGIGKPTGIHVQPGVELITHPQVRMLGRGHASAVLPLTPRPDNKVTPGMIPGLARKFGNYGRAV